MAPEHEEGKLTLSPAQVIGSALAAVSGAVLASFAGTTGTIIGTAFGSVVATVGAAIYTWWLRRTSAAVRRTAAQVRQTALAGQLPRPGAQGPLRVRNGKAVQTPGEEQASGDPGSDDAVEAEAEAEAEAEVEAAVEADKSARSIPWGKVALASVGITAAVLGGITAVEVVTGQPLSSLVGGNDTQGTTVGDVVGTGGRRATPNDNQQPSNQPTPSDEASQTPTPDPGTSPTPDVPATSVPPPPVPEPSVATQSSQVPSVVPEGAPAADPSAQP